MLLINLYLVLMILRFITSRCTGNEPESGVTRASGRLGASPSLCPWRFQVVARSPSPATRLRSGGKRAKRQKTGSNWKNIGERSGRLSARYAGRFFFPFSPNAEPGRRLGAHKGEVVAHRSSTVIGRKTVFNVLLTSRSLHFTTFYEVFIQCACRVK